jgi:hypothetical protein
VLREAGRLAFAVWAGAERNPWAAIPGRTLVELGHVPPTEEGEPGPFAISEPDRIRELVGGAGFADPDIEEVPVHWGYTAPEEHWTRTVTLSARISDRLNELSEAERERVRETVGQRVEERLAEGPHGMDGLALVVTAT